MVASESAAFVAINSTMPQVRSSTLSAPRVLTSAGQASRFRP
jgi:hypothetical protein